MEDQELGLKDYLKILKRKRRYFIIPAFLVALIGVVLAVLLPSIYSSSATILIEEQEIPDELVRSTVTTFADQRIQKISQRIMTRSNLTEIIEKYNLYEEERKKDPMEEILEEMRSQIVVDTISADVIDPRRGLPTQATIAFTLSYNSDSPVRAQKVANELTTLFLKENIKSRTSSAENAATFLKEESRRLKEKIKIIQGQLAKFKEKNLDALPEISAINQQELISLNNRLITLDGLESTLRDRKFSLQGQLAQIDPNALAVNAVGNRVFDIKDRLKVLESEYPSLLATYSQNHPDVITMKREMDSLRKQVGGNDNLNNLNAQLTEKKAELAVIQKKYSETHPDVVALSKQIDQVQNTMVEAKKSLSVQSSVEPDNPAYITLTSQLDSVSAELRSLASSRAKINSKIAKIRSNLRKAPLVEKDYMGMIQELENSTQRYREVSVREMEAEISQQLELESKGERFILIDPPFEPLEPVSPNRPAILIIGLVLAIGIGLAAVAITEMADASVHNDKAIVAVFGEMPLAVIPYMEDRKEHEANSRNKILMLGSAAAIAVIAVLLFHIFFMPIDVFWFKLLRVLGA